MDRLDLITADWARDGEWRIAPSNCHFMREGHRLIVGAWTNIGAWTKNPRDLEIANNYRICVAEVEGVAFVGGGCKWLNLADAISYVAGKAGYEERQEAIELAVKHADRLGWLHSEEL